MQLQDVGEPEIQLKLTYKSHKTDQEQILNFSMTAQKFKVFLHGNIYSIIVLYHHIPRIVIYLVSANHILPSNMH